MDPVTLVVDALVAGATQAAGDAAKESVHDAYQWLRSCLRERFKGRSQAEIVLSGHGSDPEVWDKPLRQLVTETGADTDPDVLGAAQQLLKLVDPEGSAGGRYQVDARYNDQSSRHGKTERVATGGRSRATRGASGRRGVSIPRTVTPARLPATSVTPRTSA